jgi:7-keto-8-aminopelargonate synthetase-like enzyme
MGIECEAKPGTTRSPVGARIEIDGKSYINFGGSSYLGLSSNTEIIEAGVAALRELGAGTPIPRDHGVRTTAHQAVEAEAAAFFNSQAALYLANGYLFGLVAIAGIRKSFDVVFFDESTHYSMREAIDASGLQSHSFRHRDAMDLELKIKQSLSSQQKPLVVSDGLFSSFGDIAPLDELAEVTQPYDGRLLVDESHSFGVLGQTGRGAVEQYAIRMSASIGGSLGKAFGSSGGIIPASEEEVAAFRRTRAGRGATAGLPAAAAMCATSLRYVREHPELLSRLRENVSYMKKGLRSLGLDIPLSLAPVASFVPGKGKSMPRLKAELLAEGIFVYHSTYVGAGSEGVIRCGIFADHTSEHIDLLLDALRRLL